MEYLLYECNCLTDSPSGLFSVGVEGLLVHRHGDRAVESRNMKCLCKCGQFREGLDANCVKIWNKGQKCMAWVSYPCSDSVWIRLMHSACLRWSSEILSAARKLHQHRELLFRQMFSCCRVLEPRRMLLFLLVCSLAQHPAFLC